MNRSFQTRGFTLIEVVVALTLSAVLMIVVTTVMGQAITLRNDVAAAAATLPGDELLRDQLTRDWTLADAVLVADDGFWLLGQLLRDDASGRMTQRPAVVRYRVVDAAGRWLTRTQWAVDHVASSPAVSGRASVQPLFAGVDGVEVTTDRLRPLPRVPAAVSDPAVMWRTRTSEIPGWVAVSFSRPIGEPLTCTIRRRDG